MGRCNGLTRRMDSRNLYRLENTEINVAFVLPERAHCFLMSDKKADATACHVKALREGVEFYRDVDGTRNLQNASWGGSRQTHFRIGKVMDDQHVPFFAKPTNFSKSKIGPDRNRIPGKFSRMKVAFAQISSGMLSRSGTNPNSSFSGRYQGVTPAIASAPA